MHRHLSARAWRYDPAAASRPKGFTLVELLVVITIIAMLVGLLVPAVMRAREAGRRSQCLNNQQQIGKAVMNYVTSKNKFPRLFSLQPDPQMLNAEPQAVGWVPPMLPYLEQNPLYQVFQANGWIGDPGNPNDGIDTAQVETLNCPSRNPTYSPAPLSYVVNAGMRDFRPTSPANSQRPLDYKQNGVFFDDFAWRAFGADPLPDRSYGYLKPPAIDLAYISNHDGIQMTLLVSENRNARDWITIETSPTPPSVSNYTPYPPNYGSMSTVPTWWQGFTWTILYPDNPDYGLKGSTVPGKMFNLQVQGNPSDIRWGNPSSDHPGGFIAAMCDGHAEFIDENIEYRVYCLLAAPDSNHAIDPLEFEPYGPRPRAPFKYPDKWYPDPSHMNLSPPMTPLPLLIPLTEADFEP